MEGLLAALHGAVKYEREDTEPVRQEMVSYAEVQRVHLRYQAADVVFCSIVADGDLSGYQSTVSQMLAEYALSGVGITFDEAERTQRYTTTEFFIHLGHASDDKLFLILSHDRSPSCPFRFTNGFAGSSSCSGERVDAVFPVFALVEGKTSFNFIGIS